jgi:Yip1 domain
MAGRLLDFARPFLTIWTRPRATIRWIVDSDPTLHVLLLAASCSALSTLHAQQTFEEMVQRIPHPQPLAVYFLRTGLLVNWLVALHSPAGILASRSIKVALLVVLGAAYGVVLLYVLGAFLKWSGGLLGGTATALQVRAAIAWGLLPFIIANVFLLSPRSVSGSPPLISFVLMVWGFVVLIKCIGEVHRFSAWRGLGLVAMSLCLFGLYSIVVTMTMLLLERAGSYL